MIFMVAFRSLFECFMIFMVELRIFTMKDIKSMKGQRTKLLKPCFSRRTLKLIRKPCLMPASFM